MTTVTASTTLDLRPVSAALGAEVRGVDLCGPLDDATYDALRQALLEHLVLFFPDQHLDPAQHLAFAERWGEMEVHPYNPAVEGHPEIVEIHGAAADAWHTDVTYSERPPVMTILNMVHAPDTGGDTMWSNQYAAYEALSVPLRELLDGFTAVHTATTFGHPEHRAEHPAVRVHPETGRRCLYINGRFTHRIPQLSRVESTMLLDFLRSFSVDPRFTVRYRWTTGTLAIWDNRCTQHCVVGDIPVDVPRTINRITILGDAPQGDPARWPHREIPPPTTATARDEAY